MEPFDRNTLLSPGKKSLLTELFQKFTATYCREDNVSLVQFSSLPHDSVSSVCNIFGIFCGPVVLLRAWDDIAHDKWSNVLRSFGSNNSLLL